MKITEDVYKRQAIIWPPLSKSRNVRTRGGTAQLAGFPSVTAYSLICSMTKHSKTSPSLMSLNFSMDVPHS